MTMRAIEISEPGGPEVLRLAERPIPTPGAGEILIRIAYAEVNRAHRHGVVSFSPATQPG